MTTTPTLYVGEDVHRNCRWEESFRPATHDELIAAMPRCGTCDWWRGKGTNVKLEQCDNPDTLSYITPHDFGCTEHKERV